MTRDQSERRGRTGPGIDPATPAVPAAGNEIDVWYRIGLWTVGALFRLAFRLRVVGRERIPAAGGGILVVNHVSIMDAVGVGVAASVRGRAVRNLTAAEAFDIPVVGWGLRRIRQIPIRRGMADRAALREAAARIRAGELAAVYPEGRVSDDLVLQKMQKGAARLALAAGVPLVPVGIWGTHRRWPRPGLQFRRPLRPKVGMYVGHPIPVAGDSRSAADVRALTATIRESIERCVKVAVRIAR